MADIISTELSKSSVILGLLLYVSFLISIHGVLSIYVTIIAVPIIYVVINKFSQPAAEEWIADEILGTPVCLCSTAGSSRPPALVISHRTSALDAPENTLAGIRKAKADGANAVEMDVRFTKDNIAVLMHDERIDRTTDGSGLLSELTYDQIKTLDASAKHLYHGKYIGEPIPTLEEAVNECINLDMKMFIEMKDVDEQAIVLLLEMYNKYPVLYEISAIVSFYPQFLYQVRKKDSHVVTVLVWRPYQLSIDTPTGHLEDGTPRYDSWFHQSLFSFLDVVVEWCVHHLFWYICGVNGMFIHRSVICPRYLRHWARLKMRVIVWTVNAAREKDYLSHVLNINYMTDSIQQIPANSAPKTKTNSRRRSPEVSD